MDSGTEGEEGPELVLRLPVLGSDDELDGLYGKYEKRKELVEFRDAVMGEVGLEPGAVVKGMNGVVRGGGDDEVRPLPVRLLEEYDGLNGEVDEPVDELLDDETEAVTGLDWLLASDDEVELEPVPAGVPLVTLV